jgi:hypothetical protein
MFLVGRKGESFVDMSALRGNFGAEEDLPSSTSGIFAFCRGLVGGVGPAGPVDMLVSAAVGLKVGASGLKEPDLRDVFDCFCSMPHCFDEIVINGALL